LAKVDIKMPEDFLEKIKKLGEREDSIAEAALEAGGTIVLEKARGNLANAVGNGTKYPSRSSGDLERALGLSTAKLDRDGNHNIKVGFAEDRKDGKSNAMLASILEYGKHGQPAKPFMKPAKSASKAACQAAMIRTFQEEIDKL
jgi:HK97 gp10 family phage protein